MMKNTVALAAVAAALFATPALAGPDWVYATFEECDAELTRVDPKNRNLACVYDPLAGGYLVKILPVRKRTAAG